MIGFLKRGYEALDDRVGISSTFLPIVRHPVPKGLGWWYIFGSSTLFSFIVAVVSGIPLAMMYDTATGGAYKSLQWITHGAMLGYQIRGLHYWGAVFMLIFIGLHTLRVFTTGSYKYPREVNWLIGVVLLFLTAAILFTGQILRWDAYGVWTVAITAFQADRVPFIGDWIARFLFGGYTFNATTLSRMFAIHVFILPGLLFAMIGFHLYLVIHNGISEPPKSGRPVNPKEYRAWYNDLLKRDGEPFWPYAAWRDTVAVAVIISVIAALVLFVGPPELVSAPDPSNTNVEPRPDWYFLWYFAALALVPSKVEDYVYFLAPLIFALVMFLLPILANKGERSPRRRPWVPVVGAGIVMFVATMTFAGYIAPWSPRFGATPLSKSQIGAKPNTAIYRGALLWQAHGCEGCHMISGHGGVRGPDLTDVGSRLTQDYITIRILNGAYPNMPAYGGLLKPNQVNDLVAFLESRKGGGQDHVFINGRNPGPAAVGKTH